MPNPLLKGDGGEILCKVVVQSFAAPAPRGIPGACWQNHDANEGLHLDGDHGLTQNAATHLKSTTNKNPRAIPGVESAQWPSR